MALKIAVMRDRYQSSFCTPKNSRHELKLVPFLPSHKISRHFEGVTALWSSGCDLIHAVNRIPLGSVKNFVISFESHLPRYFGGESTRFFTFMRGRLAAPNCRNILAYSEAAKRIFLATHGGSAEFQLLEEKLRVVYPNIVLPEWNSAPTPADKPLILTFIGSHFGRKGGAVAARAAEIARERQLPLHFNIVSSLIMGSQVWTDPFDEEMFAPYIRQLDARNVTYRKSLANAEVLQLLRHSDFSILTTLSDTFGFSAIESLASGTPVIVTPQGALPEFVDDGENGLIVPLATDRFGEWIYIGKSERNSRRYALLYFDEIERMANDLIERVMPYCENRERLAVMRHNARHSAALRFDTTRISTVLDKIYDDCARK